MPRDDQYLLDIFEAARIIVKYTENISKADFENDTQCQDAVIRRLEIIGEASRRITGDTKTKHPNLPWNDMTRMRNFLIHEYEAVDINIVWDTVKKNIPRLIESLETIFEE